MTINERIKNLRLENNLTLKEVADRIGVSEGTVQRYESNAIKVVPYKSIVSLADVFGCSPAYLMGWDAEYQKNDLKPLENSNAKDIELLKAYHSASDDIKACVCRILGVEL